jgi:hypothetical protein
MSRFTDLFQEPALTIAPELSSEPVKVEEPVVKKLVVVKKPTNKKLTMD